MLHLVARFSAGFLAFRWRPGEFLQHDCNMVKRDCAPKTPHVEGLSAERRLK